jgi:hypothetical protein
MCFYKISGGSSNLPLWLLSGGQWGFADALVVGSLGKGQHFVAELGKKYKRENEHTTTSKNRANNGTSDDSIIISNIE